MSLSRTKALGWPFGTKLAAVEITAVDANIDVVAAATGEHVLAEPAGQRIVAGATGDLVGEIVAGQHQPVDGAGAEVLDA